MKRTIFVLLVLCILSTLSIAFAEEPSDVNVQGQAYFDAAVAYRDNQSDGAKALETFEKAYETGCDKAGEAAYQIAWLYDSDQYGIPEDFAQGNLWLNRAIDLGYAPAMTHLALHYLWGKGVDADITKAESLAMQGLNAATNDSELLYANCQLARIYAAPDTDLTSADQAAIYAEQALQFNTPEYTAEYLWALARLYDSDAMKNAPKAIVWYEAYIGTNVEEYRTEAMWRCGWLWYHEMNLHANGLDWMKQSAEGGNADGMYVYAEALDKFENDLDTAMPWYQKAADAGNAGAQERLAELAAE